MRFLAISALLGLLAVQQAAATDSSDWSCSPGFPICAKSPNNCTNKQKTGIPCDEQSQPTSGSCTGVGGMGVQNAQYDTMKCNSNSKTKLLVRGGAPSGGQTDQKCISQTCGTSKGSGITVNKGSGGPQYSCNLHQIIVEQPVLVRVTHYNQETGQQCSYSKMCNANEITPMTNDNCGKSDYHEICVHPSSPSGPTAKIGVVGLNFDCTPGPSSSCSPPSPPATSSAVIIHSSKPVSPPLSTAPVVSTPSPIESGSTAPVVSTPSAIVSTPSAIVSTPSPIESGTTAPVVSTPSPIVSTPSPIESGSTAPVVSTPSPVSSTPSPVVSTPSPIEVGTTAPSVTPSSPSLIQLATSSAPVVIETETTSLITYTTLTSCPVTSTVVISGTTSTVVKTELITSTITTCTRWKEKTPSATPIQQGSTAPSATTTTPPGSPIEVGTTAPAPSPPPVVYTSTPVVITTTTEIVLTTLTTCPVTLTTTAPHQKTPTTITTTTVSTVLTTSISTITTTTVSPPPESPSPVVPVVPVVPVLPPAQPSPPPVFKGCVSSWFDLKGCGSNTDYDCYCQQDEVTTKVYACITDYEQDVSLQAQAMASYQGLCAKYIPQHPAIVIKSVELIPTPVSTPVAVTSAPPAPVEAGQLSTTTAPAPGSPAPTPAPSSSIPSTTVPVSVTVTVPCSVAAGLVDEATDGQLQVPATGVMAPGCTTTSLLSTQLAVPQMHFATSGTSVGLAAGTPAANEAGATAAPAPAPAPGVAGASGTVSVPATSTPATTSATFHGAAVKTSHSGVLLSVVLAAVGLVVYA